MDPWKIATAGLGTLSLVLLGTVAYLWSQSAPQTTVLETSLAIGAPDATTSQRPSRAIERSDRSVRTLPITASNDALIEVEAGTWLNDAAQPLPEPIMERAREQLREERRERGDARRDEIHDDVDAFLDEENIDAATSEKVHAAMEGMGEKMTSIRDQVRSGELERGDARQSFRQGRDELVGTFEDLLGEEVAGRLMERMPGPGGPPRSSGGGEGFRRGGGL